MTHTARPQLLPFRRQLGHDGSAAPIPRGDSNSRRGAVEDPDAESVDIPEWEDEGGAMNTPFQEHVAGRSSESSE
jgi:hypothetical protein